MLRCASAALARSAGRVLLRRVASTKVRAAPPPADDAAPDDDAEFERLSPTEHVLRRPGLYIGSTSAQSEPLWLLDEASGRMEWREAAYVPGLYKLFDEILVNALDNRQRDPKGTTEIAVTIDAETGRTSVTNTGRGIPVRMHEGEGVWIPEMVMGSLFSGSNFDDARNAKRTVGGRHGFGAKLTNLFSSAFEVETVDTEAGLRYAQRWAANMSERSEPEISTLKKKRAKDFTAVTFTPDLARFGLDSLPPDMLAILRRRVYEAAATAAPARVLLDGERVPIGGLADLARMYAGGGGGDGGGGADELAFEHVDGRWKVGACRSPTGSFQAVSFVNGVATARGGTHVNHVANALLSALVPALKLPASSGVTPGRVKPHLMLFVDCLVDNPEFDSHPKETLITPAAAFGGTCELPAAFVRRVAKLSGLRAAIEGEVAVRDTQALAKAAATSRVLNMKKLEDAEDAGGKNAAQCTLIVAEGDSAKAFADAGLEVVGRQRYGVFALRGKPLNVRDVSKKKVSENKELVNLMRALGLSPDGAAAGKAGGKLRYGRLMLMTDQDNDGFHIKGLVISMIHHYWPALLASEFVQEFHTPLLKAKRLSDGRELSFFSLRDYDAWHAELEEKEAPRWRTKYYKGLGTSTDHEARTYFSQLPRHMVQLEWGGDTDGDLIDMAFSKKRVADRKDGSSLPSSASAPTTPTAAWAPPRCRHWRRRWRRRRTAWARMAWRCGGGASRRSSRTTSCSTRLPTCGARCRRRSMASSLRSGKCCTRASSASCSPNGKSGR